MHFFAYKPKTTRHNYICKTKKKGFNVLNEFKFWLISKNYKINTANDYQSRIERLCKHENISLENLIANIKTILPIKKLSLIIPSESFSI